MAEKQDIAMNAFKVLTDVTYVYGEASDSSQGKIKKGDLAEIMGGVLNIDGLRQDFDGNFSNFTQWIKGGVYRYSLNTSSTGTVDGPYGNDPVYGILEVIVRDRTDRVGLNVVVQKIYERNNKLKIRMCSKAASDPIDYWNKGEWKQIY